jgi:(2Fe-2S) ferredoxin
VRHLFVCTNELASGKSACGRSGGQEVLAAVQQELLRRGEVARVTACGCLGPCFDGPNAVVYPDDVWYRGLEASDASAIVEHLLGGVIYAAKRQDPPGE